MTARMFLMYHLFKPGALSGSRVGNNNVVSPALALKLLESKRSGWPHFHREVPFIYK